jgi:quinol monooxygenase YgiN
VWDSPAHRDAAVRKEELDVAVTITIRARLKAEPATIQAIHDQVTAATKEMARQAGDISHIVYLDPQDRRQFLGIDTWQSAEQAQAFAGSPQIQEFFGQMFEGRPEVKVWVDPGWNKW